MSRISISAVILTPYFSNFAEFRQLQIANAPAKYNEILITTNKKTPHNTTRKIASWYTEFQWQLSTCKESPDHFWTRVYCTELNATIMEWSVGHIILVAIVGTTTRVKFNHIWSGTASQLTSSSIAQPFAEADQRKHQSSASLAFVRGIYRSPVNSVHKRPLKRKMFRIDDVIIDSVHFFSWKLAESCKCSFLGAP